MPDKLQSRKKKLFQFFWWKDLTTPLRKNFYLTEITNNHWNRNIILKVVLFSELTQISSKKIYSSQKQQLLRIRKLEEVITSENITSDRSDVFIVNFEHISQLAIVYLL